MTLSEEIRAMTGMPPVIADAVASLQGKNASLRAENERLRAEIDSLRSDIYHLRADNDDLRAALKGEAP